MEAAAKILRAKAEDARRWAMNADVEIIEYTQQLEKATKDAERFRAIAAEYEAAANVLDPPTVSVSAAA